MTSARKKGPQATANVTLHSRGGGGVAGRAPHHRLPPPITRLISEDDLPPVSVHIIQNTKAIGKMQKMFM